MTTLPYSRDLDASSSEAEDALENRSVPRGGIIMKRGSAVVLAAALVTVGLAGPAATAGNRVGAAANRTQLDSLPRRAMLGALPADPAAYARNKAVLDARAGLLAGLASPPSAPPRYPPTVGTNWPGLIDTGVTPPDSTGAVGPGCVPPGTQGRYIELVNLKFGIYDKCTTALISTGTLLSFAAGLPTDFVYDPQIIFDPGSKRFYYVMIDAANNGSGPWTLAFGFSKSSVPNSPASFCHYFSAFNYGSDIPDYPRLGDMHRFVLVGVNVFTSTGLRTDLDWITKPTGKTCPPPTPPVGECVNLRNYNGTPAFTPNPAVQTDTSTTGWVLATQDVGGGGSSNFISVFKVSAPSGSNPTCIKQHRVSVPKFSAPPDAPQCGYPGTALLDTLDGRLQHTVSAIDPDPSLPPGTVGVWTAHAVAGGAGSQERWYEITPTSTPRLAQSGAATSPSSFIWNGAISPDRQSSPPSFGDSMVMGFNTSNATSCPDIEMVSSLSHSPTSIGVVVTGSSGPDSDFSCGGVCRWVDFAGATPDPTPVAGPSGTVWLTNMYIGASQPGGTNWATFNWGAFP
jgi:hypothetical protein